MKKIIFACLVLLSASSVYAGTNPGDVNFGNDEGPLGHAVRYALRFSDGAQTGYTGCLSPNTGYNPAGVLTIGAMGGHQGLASVVAQDCTNTNTVGVISSFNYNPQYYYYYACILKENKSGSCRQGP
ncbi:MAG TPA: hypothetical protein VHE99_07790 [Gammaproteobacteria bacterium]|nr:hypothetical protein [Gammaproteobacteria bacterium]